MRKTFLTLLFVLIGIPAVASPTPEEMQLPPAGYSQPTFLHPNGCVYAKADPAGYPRTWHAISNGTRVVAGARPGETCTSVLIQPGATR